MSKIDIYKDFKETDVHGNPVGAIDLTAFANMVENSYSSPSLTENSSHPIIGEGGQLQAFDTKPFRGFNSSRCTSFVKIN